MTVTKAHRTWAQTHFPIFLWYAITGIAGLFFLLNILRLVTQYVRRRRSIERSKLSSESSEYAAAVPPPPSSVGKAYNLVLAFGKKCFLWRKITIGLWYNVPLSEIFWSAMYTMTVLILGFLFVNPGDPSKTQAASIGNLCGLLAFCQLPLVVGLASKNNVISWITGISYERLNFLHRAAGRALLILSWVHVISRGMIIGLTGDNAIQNVNIKMGIMAFIAYNLLVFTSFKPLLRTVAYEVFLISHIVLALIFLIGAYMHWTEFGNYVWPSFLIWGLDRLVRFFNVFFLNKLWISLRPSSTNPASTATVRVLPDEALEVTMERSMKWIPGQHVYVTFPHISRLPFEAHPFTIASVPSPSSPSTVTLIVRVRNGFTARLAKVAREAGGVIQVKALVDGPYGIIRSLTSYESVALVSGGSGVTYTIAHLINLVEQAKKGESAVKIVTFVWVVRNHESISWIAETLASLQSSCPPSLILDLRIFVTQASSQAALPPDSGSSDGLSSRHASVDSDEKRIEKKAIVGLPLSLSRLVKGGRPNFESLMEEVVQGAQGRAINVSICGPFSLVNDLKSTLASGNAYSLKDVVRGKVGTLDLHVENFGW